MGKARKQRRVFKSTIAKQAPRVRVTHLDSVEKINQFYQSLSPAEQKAMMQDAAQLVGEHDSVNEEIPTRYVDGEIIEQLTKNFSRAISARGEKPKPGDYIKGTSADGDYVVEAYVVPTHMPAHPVKGQPFAMKVGITDACGYRLAAKDKTLEPRFNLPDDMTRVQSLGFADGLRSLFLIFFDQYPDGSPDDQLFQSISAVQKNIDGFAQLSANLRASQDEQPVANSLDLYHQYFVESFTEGVQFSLYALPHGLMKLYYSLPEDRGFELAHRFGWEHFTKEESPDKDELIIGALDQLKAMYEEYQAAAA